MLRTAVCIVAIGLGGCAPSPAPEAIVAPTQVTHAWATFDQRVIVGSETVGMADRRTGRALTIDDPVRIASISKLAVALGAMRLVEQGKLDLDADASAYLGWKLRNPAFPDTPITLRQLLSHRSGLKDEGINYGVRLGEDMSAAVLSSFDPAHAPGTFFRYSNFNLPVIAAAMERVTGERFDRLMERLVLDPLELDACFNWSTCSDRAIDHAVVLYRLDGRAYLDDLRGVRQDCPVRVSAGHDCDLDAYIPGTNGALFSPQGGLRISLRDLATVGMLLLNRGTYKGQQFLRPESVEELQGPTWRYDGTNGVIDGETEGDTDAGFYCTYGLAMQIVPTDTAGCADDLARDRHWVGHAGDAYGLRSGLWIDPRRQTGIAYFAINNGESPPKGRSAYRAIEESLAARHIR